MATQKKRSLGVLTSGGDAPGMNAAVRAVIRTALDQELTVYGIYEGYQGMVDGGERIRQMAWGDVGGILQKGGTIIGTARCLDFRERAGRLRAARNLIERDIDSLVIIGGDGSLTGANHLRQEWSSLLDELVGTQQITQRLADEHPVLHVVGLVGSIDNDMCGTDITIGADTALHRITEAIDALTSTASSHQRTFVVEIMGRNCGYLTLMGALATGSDWIMIPEMPPQSDDWETEMCELLRAGREAGRRDSIVLVAEGAIDKHGNHISVDHVKDVLAEKFDKNVRVTILGHVQRGGAPSAFDRYMSTVLGYTAVQEIISDATKDEAYMIGMKQNRIIRAPLMQCVEDTHEVVNAIKSQAYDRAIDLRGGGFRGALETFNTLIQSLPRPPKPGQRRLRLAVMTASAPSPGMNPAVRAAVRVGLDRGHIMLGIDDSFEGLIEGRVREMNWMSVAGWTAQGGSELGTNRRVPSEPEDFKAIAANIEKYKIDGLLVIGGWAGYRSVHRMLSMREGYPAFNIPVVCLPASINNNLPGSEVSIGADTALNSIVGAVDKIKQSAVASHRAFVVEVMGRYCGYLALMSGLATGAERVYLHEEGVTLKDLQSDVEKLVEGFKHGKRLGLIIRNENANEIYSTEFMCSLFEEEGGDLFEVRHAILGHLQQGGTPTPYDRGQATRMATKCITYLIEQALEGNNSYALMGVQEGRTRFHDFAKFPHVVDDHLQRPKRQWWLAIRPIAKVLSQPGPGHDEYDEEEVLEAEKVRA